LSGVIRKLLAITVILAAAYIVIVSRQNTSVSLESDKLARYYYQNSYFREAAKEFETAFENGLRSTDSLYRLAYCYQFTSKTTKAREAYLKVIKKQPNNLQAYYQLGLMLSKMKRYDEAVEWQNKVVKIDTNFVPAYILAGLIREKQDRTAEASQYFQAAVSISNNRFSVKFAKKHLSQVNQQKGYHLTASEWLEGDKKLIKARRSAIIPFISDKERKNGWYKDEITVSFFSNENTRPIFYKIGRKSQRFLPYSSPVKLSAKDLKNMPIELKFGFNTAPAYVSKLEFKIDGTAPKAYGKRPGILAGKQKSISVFLKDTVSGIDLSTIKNSVKIFALPFMGRIDGNVKYNLKTKALYFIPRNSLTKNKIYIAALSSQVKDLAGNRLPLSKIWVFRN
jgi:tetratricopeptide (TPR) repeat protein